jgi:hypothetical protein
MWNEQAAASVTHTLRNLDSHPHYSPPGAVVFAIPISEKQIIGHKELFQRVERWVAA